MKKNLIIMLVIVAFFSSCSEKKEAKMPRSVGGSSEILLITQNDEQWNGTMGQTVRDFFEVDQYGLPQPEKTFKVAHINQDAFSDMFKKHRNLIIGAINSDLKNAVVESQADWTAAPQYVMKITAPNMESWVKAFDTQKEGLKLFFDQNERTRLMEFFRPTTDYSLIRQLKNKFGISMAITEGYYIAVETDNFAWLRKEMDDMSFGFLITELPYKDTADLNPTRIIQVRDSIVKKYIPGPADNSYMSTDKEFLKPVFKNLPDFPAGYAVETRGLWNTVGDFMAGPFVSYTVVNPERTKLVTVEGFIYYPNKNKRDYLRQMEAILYSLKFEK